MRRFWILCLLCGMMINAGAEDGSRLWLRGDYAEGSGLTVKTIGGKDNNGTLRIAERELRDMGWSGSVVFRLKSFGAHSDAYVIKSEGNALKSKCGASGVEGGGKTVIQSATPAGILYGVYDLLRRKQTDAELCDLDIKESPTYGLRILNHWDNLDGTIERGYAGNSLWKWDELPGRMSPRYEQYARACASVGINATVLNNVNAAPEMLDGEYLIKVKALADVFRPYGIKTFLCVNFASPKELGGLDTADPLDRNVVQWWKEKVKEIYRLVPNFGGFLVKANSEGKPGPCDYGRTHAEGANMLADVLKPYNGIVMWRAFVYNAQSDDRAMQACEEFEPLDGKFRDNVIVQIKNGPVDFQPREPYNPLFGKMPDTQQMVEFQITQEYLGAANHIFYQVPLWKECLDSRTYNRQSNPQQPTSVSSITSHPLHGYSAIAGVANIGDDINWCGHVFAQANWYAFGRLAWNAGLSAETIAEEWLSQTFTCDDRFVKPMTRMMLETREAVVNYMMPIGLHHIFAEVHHYGPAPWYMEEGMRKDWSPLYYHRADTLGIGFDRTMKSGSGATAQYAEPVRSFFEQRESCPDVYLLWFHRVGWNERVHSGRTLWEEMCHRYCIGVEAARDFQKRWDAMEAYVDKERFIHVQNKLKIQTHDAQWWKDACLLYFQQFSRQPFPADMERPVYELKNLMDFHIGISVHGNPKREQLP